MATNKLLPFANGVGANVTDYDTWSALATLLSQGFTTGVARSDYANRVFAQGALASYILGQFVVDQTAQDADLNESVFYTNFKNALTAYIKGNAVSLDTVQTVGGVKNFTSSPIVPDITAGDNTQKVANTAFVKTAIDNSVSSVKAVSFGAQTLTDAEKTQARTNIGAPADSDVVKLATTQTITGDKNFTGALQKDGKDIIPNDVEEIEAAFTSNVADGGIVCAVKIGKIAIVSFYATLTTVPANWRDIDIITVSVTHKKTSYWVALNNIGPCGILQINNNANTIKYRTLQSANINGDVRGTVVFAIN